MTLDDHRITRLTISLTLLCAVVFITTVATQGLTDARRLYEAGKYRETIDVVATANADAQTHLRLLYLEAQSHERLGEPADAERVYAELAASQALAWQSVGQSALGLLHKQPKEALAAATEAVSVDPTLAEAQYQLGFAFTVNEDFAKAASAFDKAAELDPQWAYPRYYAGLAYSKVKRIDLLAARFDAFLKLAPNAPERPEVESIMRTFRGR